MIGTTKNQTTGEVSLINKIFDHENTEPVKNTVQASAFPLTIINTN
jgi:hypothetical protein